MYIEKRFLVVTIVIILVFINSANAIAGAAAQETAEMVCSGGDTRPCGSNIGVCEDGIRTCINGEWGICVGGTEPSLEKCDGLDNDCDSLIDENFDVDKDTYTMCGTRTTDGSYVIADCDNSNPNVNPGAKEICNLIDDNCDGVIDEGCECIDGDTRPCGSNIGVCEAGVRTCVNGEWGECLGGIGPDEEVCDGLDNNCDGVVDEGSLCSDGQSCINSVCVVPYGCIDDEIRPCGSNVGMCESGTVTCINGVWDECIGGTRPTYEICDGLDNDCDSVVDEGCPVIKPELIKIKNDFRSYERPEFEIDARPVKIELYDVTGKAVDIQPEIQELEPNRFKIMIPEKRQFRAGLYTIKIDVIKNGVTYFEEQNFTWGVLAINTHKSIYLPDEDAFIGIAVLDDEGHMVCDADVALVITDPNNVQTRLSTANGDIKISPECEVYGVTNLPDYYTSYNVNGVGAYSMELTAMTYNGERSITDSFVVEQLPDFDVARSGPTRIYPPVPYTMSFTIKANRGYSGLIREYVPAGFEITPQPGLNIRIVGDAKELTWNKNLVNGETYNIYYEFDAPDISPEMFVLGPLEIGSWEEARQWMIASDAPPPIIIEWNFNPSISGTQTLIGLVLNVSVDGSCTRGKRGNYCEGTVTLQSNGTTITDSCSSGESWKVIGRSYNINTCDLITGSGTNGVYYNCTKNGVGSFVFELEACVAGIYTVSTSTVNISGLVTEDSDPSVEIIAPDNPPLWRNQGQNVSIINVSDSVKLFAQGTDGFGLWEAYLSTNETGSWINYTGGTYGSPINLGNVTVWTWSNFTWVNDSIGPGENVYWSIWYRDDISQWNETNILTFSVVDEVIPNIGNKFINESGPVFTNSIVCLNVSGISDNWQVDKVWATVTQSDGSVSSVTFSDTGSCAGISGDGWYSADVNAGPVAGTFYYNTTYVNDTSGNMNTNNVVLSLDVVVPPDTTPPQWSNKAEFPGSPTVYSPGQGYQFNITWSEPDSGIDAVLMEHNFTGALQNYTVTSSVGNEYYYDWNDLAAGYYVWRGYANNTDGYMNVTDQFGYIVSKASSSCTLSITPPSPTTYNQSPTITATGSCDNPEASENLYMDGVLINSENGVAVSLAAGSYDYEVNVTDTQNYTGNSASETYIVNQAIPTSTLTLLPSNSEIYGTETNVSCSYLESEVTPQLFRDGEVVFNPDVQTLAVGVYSYTCNNTATQNYTSTEATDSLTINQAVPTPTLTITPSNSETYGTQTTVTCSYLESEVTPQLYRNGQAVSNPDIEILAADTYDYVCNNTETQNYTINETSGTLIINQADNPVYLYLNDQLNTNVTITYGTGSNATGIAAVGANLFRDGLPVTNPEITTLAAGLYAYKVNASGNQNYTDNSTGATYYLNVTGVVSSATLTLFPPSPITYGVETNASCSSTNPEAVANLYRNGTEINSENGVNVTLAAGGYDYVCNVTETQNYTSATDSGFYTVNKASSEVNLLLNGTDSNFSINEDEYANLTAYLVSGQGIIKLYQGGILINSGYSPLENITLYPDPELFNITVIYDENENYTGSFEIHWLEINDTTPPNFSNHLRDPNLPNEDQDIQVNVTVIDNVGVNTVLLEWDGSVNYTVFTSVGDEYYFTILSGNYTAHDLVTYYWYASDSAGNLDRSVQQSFTVTNQLPWLNPVPSLNDTAPQTNDLLNCTAGTFQDNDEEDVEQARFWRWYNNDTEVMGENSQTLDLGISGNGDKGDVIKCSEKVYDGYDNSSWFNSSNTAIVQNTPPTQPVLDLPIDDYNTSDSTPFFNWTQSSDADGDIITYEILIDDESGFNLPYIQSSIVSNNNYTAGFLNDGVYYWRVKAVTQDANSSYTSFRTFEIDTTPPQWSDLEYDSIIIFNNNQTVNITVTDQLSYVDTVMLEWNGTINYTMGKNGNVYTWTKNETEVSIINITIFMNDSLGNMNETSFSYQIASGDIIPPNIVIDSPINQTYNTNWVYANVTLNEAGDWCGYSLDGAGNVTMNNDSSVHFYANVSGLGESQHNIRFSCNDTVGNINVTEAVYFTIDTIPPEYSGLSESGDPIVYDDSLQINATWIDLISSVDTVWFRSNYTGSWVNYSPSSSGNEYYYNFAPMQIPAGVLYYNWYANDSQGHWNTIMPVQTVTIDKASRIANLSFDKTSPITYGLTLIASCAATNPEDGVIKLYRNISGIDTDVTNTENGTEIVLPAGYWKYICNITETQNYTSATTTEFFMVNKVDHTIHLALNGSESDQSFDYPMLTNATGWLEIGQGSATLYRNGSVVSNPEIATLSAGYYNYTYVYPESENYTGQTETWFLTINKGATIITLNASPGWSVIYGTGVNVSCSVNNNEVNLQLFRNGVDVTGENGVIVDLGAGNYNYVCNNTATQNYTSAQNSNTLNVNKAPTVTELYLNGAQDNLSVIYPTVTNASAFTDVLSVTLYRNGSVVSNPEIATLSAGYYNYTTINPGNENYTGSSETLFLEVNRSASSCSLVFDPSSPINYGTQVNASCSCDNPEASAKLFRNGTDVTSSENSVFVGLAAGDYDYVCNITETQNYTSAETFGVYVVNKSSAETSLYINGTRSNRSYNVNDTANFTVILNVSGRTVYLDTNITGWILQSGTTPLENITTLAEIGYFNVTGYFLGDENYTNSSETHFITVSEGGDVQPPEWSNNQTDIVDVYSPTTLSYFNITWNDNIAVDTVLIEGNWLGSAKNYSMVNIGSVYQYSTILPAGTFYWKSYANDSAGNLNASDTWVFSVNNALEEVNLLLNGIDNNLTVNYTDSVNMTVYLNLNENVFLYVDGVLYESGLPPLENISNFPIGSYNITGTYSGNQNYSGSFETHWLSVIDEMPPVITNVNASSITFNSAIITWDTDEPADTNVIYYYNVAGPYFTGWDLSYVLFHNISLTDLANGTTYYFIVSSYDISGNYKQSAEYQFTTLACVEDWDCGSWSGDNCGTRNCTDQNSCGTEFEKPIETLGCPPEEPPVTPPTPPPEELRNATWVLRLLPGIWLERSAQLQEGTEKILGVSNLTTRIIENLLRTSRNVTPRIYAVRSINVTSDTSTLYMGMVYDGDKPVNNFIVYDTLPKSFAESSDDIEVTVDTAVVAWEIVEPDPQYVFLYSELLPQQEVTIIYKINRKVDLSDIVNKTFTEVYAESFEGVIVCNNNGICEPELGENENTCPGDCPITLLCEPYEFQCVGDVLQQCNELGNEWFDIDECEWGCSDDKCNPRPPEVSSSIILLIVIIIIGFVLAYTIISSRSKKRKAKPEKKKPGILDKIAKIKVLGSIVNALKKVKILPKRKKQVRLTRTEREKLIAESLEKKIAKRIGKAKEVKKRPVKKGEPRRVKRVKKRLRKPRRKPKIKQKISKRVKKR